MNRDSLALALALAFLLLPSAAAAAADPDPAAPAATPAPPADPAPVAQPDPRELWRGAAWEAVALGDAVVALEEDFCHLVALDLASGRVRWRRAFQEKPNGFHRLWPIGGRLFVHAGNQLVEVAPKDGRVLGRGEVMHNRRGCVLQVSGALAGVTCDDGLWLVPLDPIRLGAHLRAGEIHLYDQGLGAPHSTHFLNSARHLLGAVEGLAVVATEDREAPSRGVFRASAALFGLDPTSGEVRWRTPELATDGLTAAAVTADGAVAWVLSESTRAVGAIDPKTGALRWKVTPKGDAGAETDEGEAPVETPFSGDLAADGRIIVILIDNRIEARAVRDGKRGWSRPAAGASRVVVLGGAAEPLVFTGDQPEPVAVATVGGEVTVHTVPAHGSMRRDAGGGLVIAGPGAVTTIDPTGRVTGTVPGPDSGSWTVTADAVGGFAGGHEAIFARRDGSRLAGFPEGVGLVASRGPLWVISTPGEGPGRPRTLRLLRVEAPGASAPLAAPR